MAFLVNQPEQLDLPACEGCFRGAQQPGEQMVLLVIGSGLKNTQSAIQGVGRPHVIEPNAVTRRVIVTHPSWNHSEATQSL